MKTKNIKVIFFLIVGVIFSIISGCFSSNASSTTPYYTISNEFAGYCWFEPGSYWIFQDDSTLATDSVKITDMLVSKRFDSNPTSHNYEAVELTTTTNIFNISEYELTGGDHQAATGEMTSLMRFYKSDGTYFLTFLPQYAFGDEIILGDQIGTYTNVEKLDTYDLNSNTYTNVYHTRIVISVDNNIEYNYWIAQNHGLIKAVSVINGTTYSISLLRDNLINHNITQ